MRKIIVCNMRKIIVRNMRKINVRSMHKIIVRNMRKINKIIWNKEITSNIKCFAFYHRGCS